jgi:hypothetical protein
LGKPLLFTLSETKKNMQEEKITTKLTITPSVKPGEYVEPEAAWFEGPRSTPFVGKKFNSFKEMLEDKQMNVEILEKMPEDWEGSVYKACLRFCDDDGAIVFLPATNMLEETFKPLKPLFERGVFPVIDNAFVNDLQEVVDLYTSVNANNDEIDAALQASVIMPIPVYQPLWVLLCISPSKLSQEGRKQIHPAATNALTVFRNYTKILNGIKAKYEKDKTEEGMAIYNRHKTYFDVWKVECTKQANACSELLSILYSKNRDMLLEAFTYMGKRANAAENGTALSKEEHEAFGNSFIKRKTEREQFILNTITLFCAHTMAALKIFERAFAAIFQVDDALTNSLSVSYNIPDSSQFIRREDVMLDVYMRDFHKGVLRGQLMASGEKSALINEMGYARAFFYIEEGTYSITVIKLLMGEMYGVMPTAEEWNRHLNTVEKEEAEENKE